MKKFFFLLFFSTLFTTAFSQDAEKDYSEAIQLIEVWLDAQKDFDKLPGLSAVVMDDQEVLWSGAVGLANPDKNIKAKTTTLCSICSISKLFTSVAIMKLYDEGKLRLDDRVSDLLPAYKLAQKYPESGPITIRSLLTHSSGLPRESAHPYWTGPDFPFPTKAEIDAGLSQQETLYPASTYFQYSNLGLTLLGEIVEEISGLPYDEYVQKNILTPLGLSDTRPEMPERLYGDELAIGYSALTRSGDREKVNFFQAKGITPAAGFSSNVLDLGKFAAWQFRLRDTTVVEILKPSTLKFMQTVHWTNPDWSLTWGLGFFVYKGSNGTTWVGHGGSCPGYRSTLQLDLKNKRAYSVMINSSGTNPGKYVKGISSILDKVKPTKDEDSEEMKNLQEYAGYYSPMPWASEVYISSWEGKLVELNLPTEDPGKAMTLYKHIEGDTFRRIRDDDELGESLIFERDKSGNIIRYSNHGNYYKKIKR
jgi:CubicO group peptidase (beta-lactamase class C family)